MNRSTSLIVSSLALAAISCSGVRGAEASSATGKDVLTVQMEACQMTRPGLLFTDKLVKRGIATVDGKDYTFYLPKAKAYSVKNTRKKDDIFSNTSTKLSIDQNGSGKLTQIDSWFANLPVRLGDRMFDVVDIAADGSRIALKPSTAPLAGVVVGRSCPPFSFKTVEGKTVSRESLAGKPYLLDIWSIT
jgi:hypothetical protein